VSYIYLDFSKTCGALDNPGEKCSLSDRRREKKKQKNSMTVNTYLNLLYFKNIFLIK
jgi:hypothetical protein